MSTCEHLWGSHSETFRQQGLTSAWKTYTAPTYVCVSSQNSHIRRLSNTWKHYHLNLILSLLAEGRQITNSYVSIKGSDAVWESGCSNRRNSDQTDRVFKTYRTISVLTACHITEPWISVFGEAEDNSDKTEIKWNNYWRHGINTQGTAASYPASNHQSMLSLSTWQQMRSSDRSNEEGCMFC